jgi:alpha-N-arabinofuranosidase
VNVVNRHRTQPLEVDFEAEDKQFNGNVEVTEVNGPDIKSENTFDAAAVKPVKKSAMARGKTLHYSFPPHSYTMLKTQLG